MYWILSHYLTIDYPINDCDYALFPKYIYFLFKRNLIQCNTILKACILSEELFNFSNTTALKTIYS